MHEAAAPGPRAGPAVLTRGGGLGAIVQRAQARSHHLPPQLLSTRGLVQRCAALRGRIQPPCLVPKPQGWTVCAQHTVPGPWCAAGCARCTGHGQFCVVHGRGARSRSWCTVIVRGPWCVTRGVRCTVMVHGAWPCMVHGAGCTVHGLCAWCTVVVHGRRAWPMVRGARCRSQNPAHGGRGTSPFLSPCLRRGASLPITAPRWDQQTNWRVSARRAGREGALCK